MDTTVTIGLSGTDMKLLAKQIRQAKKAFIQANKNFVERLIDIGIPVVEENIATAVADPNASKEHTTQKMLISVNGDNVIYELVIHGEKILFIEFGAGVFFNGNLHGSQHPQGVEFGYKIGEYGLGKGRFERWSYVEDGVHKTTQGQQAAASIPAAMGEIKARLNEVAQETFNDAFKNVKG